MGNTEEMSFVGLALANSAMPSAMQLPQGYGDVTHDAVPREPAARRIVVNAPGEATATLGGIVIGTATPLAGVATDQLARPDAGAPAPNVWSMKDSAHRYRPEPLQVVHLTPTLRDELAMACTDNEADRRIDALMPEQRTAVLKAMGDDSSRSVKYQISLMTWARYQFADDMLKAREVQL